MESSTEILRKLLDERGVEWWPMRNNGYYEDRDTEFAVNGKKHTAHEWGDGLAVYNLTPEQAIAATLGRGECERTTTRNGKFKTKYGRKVPLCECCGYAIGDDRYNFCPKCGAKIVEAVKR